MPNIINAVLSAAITGGLGALATQVFDKQEFGQGLDLKHVGGVFVIGALLGVVNHYRTPPGKVAVPDNNK